MTDFKAPQTPQKPKKVDKEIHSTPQDCGTAGVSEYNANESVRYIPNLEHMNIDLGKSETSGFVDMLKAFLARMLMDDKDISAITKDISSEDASKAIQALEKRSDGLYDSLVSSAIDFCNKHLSTAEEEEEGEAEEGGEQEEEGEEEEEEEEEGEEEGEEEEEEEEGEEAEKKPKRDVKLCQDMKKSLRQFCKASSEAGRYDHLVAVINTILCNFRSHEFKDMITPDEMDDNELIFIANDPAVIKTDVTGTERKPDIIATSPDTLNSWFSDLGVCNWTNWRSKIDKGTKPPTRLNRGWLGARQPWELKKFRKLLKSGRLTKAYSVQDLTEVAPGDDKVMKRTAEKKSNQSSNPSSTGTGPGKRKREPEDYIESTDSKKQKSLINDLPIRKSHASDAQYVNKPPPTSDNLCSPDVQLGYYALERLRAAWNITHATGVLLQDTQLQLWYYDSQGGIQTHYIDILEQLPLFVVMVMIFQRFDSRMWGERDTQICSATHSKTYHMIEKTQRGPHFQLRGRRPFIAKVSEVPVVSAKNTPVGPKTRAQAKAEEQTEIKFFKGAWPEVPRGKEPVVLAEAHRRAEELLDEPFKSYVKDHIPTVEAWDELPDTSTALIRCFLGLPTENARVQLWMVSSAVLEPARKLAPQDFWVALWEAIRCHYLLWRIGIAHGDISLSNIMYNPATKKCVLNDYDLSSIMDPGTEVPDRQGYERTGTRPFMALDLLKPAGVAGHIGRRYRHDLESFCWVLAWVAACVQDGKEKLNGVYAKIAGGTHDEVCDKKWNLLNRMSTYATTKDYGNFLPIIRPCLQWWRQFHTDQDDDIMALGQVSESKSAGFIPDCLVKPVQKAKVDKLDVPMQTNDWLAVEVSPSLWRQYQERFGLCTSSQ